MERVQPRLVHYLARDAPDVGQEYGRYAGLLAAAPIDVALMGHGENGHIGFNDPHEADFHHPYKEGPLADPALVPRAGLTLRCPALMAARVIVCCVPGRHKAEAVRNALELPILEFCPGSILRAHQNAHLFVDTGSASLLARQDGP